MRKFLSACYWYTFVLMLGGIVPWGWFFSTHEGKLIGTCVQMGFILALAVVGQTGKLYKTQRKT